MNFAIENRVNQLFKKPRFSQIITEASVNAAPFSTINIDYSSQGATAILIHTITFLLLTGAPAGQVFMNDMGQGGALGKLMFTFEDAVVAQSFQKIYLYPYLIESTQINLQSQGGANACRFAISFQIIMEGKS